MVDLPDSEVLGLMLQRERLPSVELKISPKEKSARIRSLKASLVKILQCKQEEG